MEDQFKTLIVLSHYLEVSSSSSLVAYAADGESIQKAHYLGILLLTVLIFYTLHLQTARFRQFWDEAAKNRQIVEVVPGKMKYIAVAF